MDPAGIGLTTSRLRQHRQLPVVQHVRFTQLELCQKTQSQWRARGCTGQLTTHEECTGVNFMPRLLMRLYEMNAKKGFTHNHDRWFAGLMFTRLPDRPPKYWFLALLRVYKPLEFCCNYCKIIADSASRQRKLFKSETLFLLFHYILDPVANNLFTHYLPPNLQYKRHQILKLKCFSQLFLANPLKPGVKLRIKM